VEKYIDKKIKVIRTKNGGELCEMSLSSFATSVAYHDKIPHHIPHRKLDLLKE
jgi:hypothetical protein